MEQQSKLRKDTYEKLANSIYNVSKVLTQNPSLCSRCIHYIPITDSRVPEHFKCSKVFEFLDFPITINEIYITEEDTNNKINCLSFMSK